MRWLARFFEPKITDSTRFERLEAKHRELSDEVAALERRMKHIELDWDQTYDKFMHLNARLTKRQKTIERETEALAAQDAPTAPNANGNEGYPLGQHERLAAMRKRVFGGGR